MKDRQSIKEYLYEHIPLSKAMGVEVVEAVSDRVLLKAPLAPNINHRETVFGGSASALCILSAWPNGRNSEEFPIGFVVPPKPEVIGRLFSDLLFSRVIHEITLPLPHLLPLITLREI